MKKRGEEEREGYLGDTKGTTENPKFSGEGELGLNRDGQDGRGRLK